MTEELRTDVLTTATAARFAATFDRSVGTDAAPQGIHWCLCTPEVATEGLGVDGHPAGGGGFLPSSVLPRRMWASSDVAFLRPIQVGDTVERRSAVTERVEKSGSSGKLMFVTVDHMLLAAGTLAVREKQTIVYRAAAEAKPGQPERMAFPQPDSDRGAGWSWRRPITPSTALLFRYSALTFNSHRIHYDLAYARHEEAYPGLVVHGPLMASLLLDLCDRELGGNRLAAFSFRGQSPAFAEEPLLLVGKPDDETIDLAVLGADGRTVMSATARLA